MDEPKSRSDRLLKSLLTSLAGASLGDDDSPLRDLVGSFVSKAGRGKDEVIQILGREIGLALAAVLAKPLEHMAENKRIRISVELVPKITSKKNIKHRRKNEKSEDK